MTRAAPCLVHSRECRSVEEAGREVPRLDLLLTLRALVAFSDSIVQFIQITEYRFLELSCEGQPIGMDDPG